MPIPNEDALKDRYDRMLERVPKEDEDAAYDRWRDQEEVVVSDGSVVVTDSPNPPANRGTALRRSPKASARPAAPRN